MKSPENMNKTEVLKFFNDNFGNYDDWISKVVPNYKGLQEQIINSIGCFYADTGLPIDVLELGVGSGTTSKAVLSTYSNANLTGIEFSPEMVKLANNKLSMFDGRYQIRQGDFMDNELDSEKYDVIISSLSIHHYPIEEIDILMKRLFSALKPGGIFINADIVKFKSETLSTNAQQMYLDFLREQLDDEFAIKVWERHIELQDQPSLLEDLIKNLYEVGFKDVASPYVDWGFAVYLGRKNV